MATIQQIKEKFSCLPQKDVAIATKFLDKRDFISLEELVNSDVEKITKRRFTLEVAESMICDGEPNEELLALETQYEAIKELQTIVSEQAAAFKEDDLDKDYLEDDSLDYYA